MKKYNLKIKNESKKSKYVLVRFESEKELKEWINLFYEFEKEKKISQVTFKEIFYNEEDDKEEF
tara:strand:- start:641 stop:832 length:192 start_codon:yes stop_codon:yes gene_type:complete